MININNILRYYEKNRIEDLLNLIYDYARNENFNLLIDELINDFKNNRIDINMFINNTGRMSIIERDIFK